MLVIISSVVAIGLIWTSVAAAVIFGAPPWIFWCAIIGTLCITGVEAKFK